MSLVASLKVIRSWEPCCLGICAAQEHRYGQPDLDARQRLAHAFSRIAINLQIAQKTCRALEPSEGSALGTLSNPLPNMIDPKDSRYERATVGEAGHQLKPPRNSGQNTLGEASNRC